uniref:SFRICE_029131 n=1 Tax=Spodoptera frugiperda TaxID=7108 RepID=A0A2H1WEB2_SPOFR
MWFSLFFVLKKSVTVKQILIITLHKLICGSNCRKYSCLLLVARLTRGIRFDSRSGKAVARSLEMCPIYGNMLTPYYLLKRHYVPLFKTLPIPPGIKGYDMNYQFHQNWPQVDYNDELISVSIL